MKKQMDNYVGFYAKYKREQRIKFWKPVIELLALIGIAMVAVVLMWYFIAFIGFLGTL